MYFFSLSLTHKSFNHHAGRADMGTVISCLEYYGGLAPAIVGHHVRLPGGSWGVASREPLGVVGKIILLEQLKGFLSQGIYLFLY